MGAPPRQVCTSGAPVGGRGVSVPVRRHHADAGEDVAERLGHIARREPIIAGGR